jgi:hypothetical protein
MKHGIRAAFVGKLLVAPLLLALAMVLLTFGAAPAAQAQGPGPAGAKAVTAVASTGSLNLVRTAIFRGDWVAAGTGLRDRGFGTITISGIPSGSTVQAAYLFWDIIHTSLQTRASQATFNGSSITGTLVGQDADPCWLSPPGYNFAYRADVTALVKQASTTGNGSYPVGGFWSWFTQGQDPWATTSPPPMVDGASLIVFYSNPTLPVNGMQLYNGSRALIGAFNNSYTLTMSGFLAPAVIHKAKTTFVMGDGQTNYTLATDTVWFNGSVLPFQFNGADPQSGPNYIYGNLWDTISQDVTPYVAGNSTSATAMVSTHECLVWVAQVLSIR